MPDRRAGEAGHDLDAELRGRPGGVLHPLGGAAADALGVAVAPDLGRQDGAVALVDRVADGLADEVVADRPAAQAVALEQLAAAGDVAGVAQRLGDVEVVAPAGELEAVEAPAAAALGELGEREVGPLAGEQRDGTCHAWLLLSIRPADGASLPQPPAVSSASRPRPRATRLPGTAVRVALFITCLNDTLFPRDGAGDGVAARGRRVRGGLPGRADLLRPDARQQRLRARGAPARAALRRRLRRRRGGRLALGLVRRDGARAVRAPRPRGGGRGAAPARSRRSARASSS